jgi:hypothetical protein
MKAIVQERFGPPGVLPPADIEPPEVGADDVLGFCPGENVLALTGLIEAGKLHRSSTGSTAGRHGRGPAPRGAGARTRQDRGDRAVGRRLRTRPSAPASLNSVTYRCAPLRGRAAGAAGRR